MRRYLLAVAGLLISAVTLCVSGATRYVDLNNPAPEAPYTNWVTAATNIQDAIDVSAVGDKIWVTNGLYNTGGRREGTTDLTNRVEIDKALTVQSVNGPGVTTIEGRTDLIPGIRCVYLASQAVLSGFTLTNGGQVFIVGGGAGGGGVACGYMAVVTNCIITGCIVSGDAGGVSGGIIRNCVLTNNSAYSRGGGALGSALSGCVLVNNTAREGGGASSSTLTNCLLLNNHGDNGNSVNPSRGGGAANCTLTNCTLSGNDSTNSYGYGGGASLSTLIYCTVSANKARYGGGIEQCTVTRALISSNTATYGGGSYNSTLGNSVVFSNSATYGGGGYASILTACVMTNNRATSQGGGSFSNMLNNCILFGNSAGTVGGGAYRSTLNNCTVVSNAGTGVYESLLSNCVAFYNTADLNHSGSTLNHCCTTPMPVNGIGNFTAAPLLIDVASGNLRLQNTSPCINAGFNAAITNLTDLDGNPRIAGGTVDVGAYEFQLPTSVLSYAWAQQYGLPTDGTADYADGDGDGLNNWQEWRARTDPTDIASVLRMLSVSNSIGDATVSWTSVGGVSYFLQRSTDLGVPSFVTLATNIVGSSNSTSYTDPTLPGEAAYYRVGVQP